MKSWCRWLISTRAVAKATRPASLTRTIICGATIVSLAFSTAALATSLAVDQFNGYAAGTAALNGKTGGSGWCGSGSVGWFTTGTGLDIASGTLTYSKDSLVFGTAGSTYVSTGSNGENDFRKVTTYYGQGCSGAGNPVWISFLVRMKSGANNGGYAGVSLFSSDQSACSSTAGTGPEQIIIGKRNGSGNPNWGFQYGSSAGSVGNSCGIAFDTTTRLIVMQLNSATQWKGYMWVDPPLGSTPTAGSQGSAAGYCEYLSAQLSGSTCFDKIRIQAGNGSALDIDEFRMGTSYSDVIAVAAPATPTIGASANPACSGSTITFTCTPGSGSGTAPSYQWKKNGANISGATASTYNGVAGTDFVNGDQITCQVTQGPVASGITAQSATSAATTMTVNTAISITGSGSDQTVCSGANATFTVTATGTSPTYQWRKNGANISNGATGNGSTYSGALTASLTVNGAVAADAASSANGFDCVVSGASPCGSQTSTRRALTISSGASISGQPTAQSACSTPGAASFSVTAAGAALTYQWRLNGVNLSNGGKYSGVTTATLSLSGLTSGDTVAAGSGYDCVISSACGSPVTSDRVGLTVYTAPSISGQPTAQTACSSPGTASFTVTATGDGLTYQWRKNGVNLSDGAGISGATTATLSLSSLTSANTVAAGVGYDCVVSGTSPCNSTTSDRVALTVNTVPSISASPSDQAVCPSANATFSVTASGTGLTYQWRKGGVNISDGATGNGSTYSGATTATLTINTVQAADAVAAASGFDCTVSGTAPCATAQSSKAGLSLNTVASISSQPSSGAFCGGSTANLTVTAAGTSPSYAWRKKFTGWGSSGAWTVTDGGGGVFVGNSDIATSSKSWGLYNNGGTVTTAIRNFNALAVGQVFQIDMDNGSIDTGGTVGFGLRNASGQNMVEFYFIGGESFYKINSSAGSNPTTLGYTSTGVRFNLTLTSATTYSIVLTKLSNNSTYGPFTGSFLTSGSITQVRLFNSNGNNNKGSAYDCFFNSVKIGPSVTAPFYEDDATSYSDVVTGDNLGNGPLANGSTGNGSTVSGATSATLSISTIATADAGQFDVVVYNSCGGELSSVATVTVNSAPSISTTSLSGGGVGVSYSRTVTATGGSGSGYSFSISSGSLPAGLSLAPSTGVISGTPTTAETANFTVQVQDSNGCTGTKALSITIVGCPTITVSPSSVPNAVVNAVYASQTMSASGGTAPYTYSVTSGSLPAGVTLSSGVLSGTPTGAGSYSFDITATDNNSCTGVRSYSMTVGTPPSIASGPANQTACTWSTATFSVTAAGTGPFSYAWSKKSNAGWLAGWAVTGSGSVFKQTSTQNNNGTGSCSTFSASAHDINSSDGTSLGMYGGSSGDEVATRSFAPLAAGQVVSIDVDNGSVDSGRKNGFSLQTSGGTDVLQFYFLGGGTYRYYDAAGERDTGMSFGRFGLRVVFILTSSSTYTLYVTPCGGSTSEFNGSCSGTIEKVKLFNQNTTGGDAYNMYFNNFVIGGYVDNANNYSGDWGSGTAGNKGDAPITGATSSSLGVTPASTAANGDKYQCVVYSAYGTYLSSAATLTVNQTPTAFNVTGGTACSDVGVTVGLDGSEVGVTYVLYRNGLSTGQTVAGSGSAVSFLEVQTAAGTYTVVAVADSGGCTANMAGSATVNAEPTITLGSNPTVQSGTTSADLTYSAISGSPDQYRIDYDSGAESLGFVDVAYTSLPSSPIALVVPASAPNGTYNGTLYVRNSSTGCEGAGLAIQVTISSTPPPPAAPVASAATAIGTTSFQANWSKDVTVTHYDIDVSTSPTFSSFVHQNWGIDFISFPPGNTLSETFNSLTPGQTYYYRVRAVGDGGTSDNSNAITVTLPSTATVSISDIPPSGGNGTVTFSATVGASYDVYYSDSDPGGSMSWNLVNQVQANANPMTVTAPEGTRRYFKVVIAGASPSSSSSPVWGVIRPTVQASTFTMMSPPLDGNRAFNGTFGANLAAALTSGDQVHIYEPTLSNWRTLTLSGGTWMEGVSPSGYELAAGQGFFVLRTVGSSAQPRFVGPVGNTGSAVFTVVPGNWNIMGLSQGKNLTLNQAFSSFQVGSPQGSWDESAADLVVIQNSNGSWHRIMRAGNDTWFDLSTFGTANVTFTPGQAFYYYRQNAGNMQVTF